MNKFKTAAQETVGFVRRHRVAVAVALTTAVAIKTHNKVMAEVNEFLTEKGLFDEYYTPID